jgi:hypothetical protein
MTVRSGLPDPADAPWPQYATAIVEVLLDGAHLVVTPCSDAEADGGRPLAAWDPPIWVLTAGDPYPVELTAEENSVRNAHLRSALDALGLRHDPALGRAPDHSTSEVSVAVRGADRATVLQIAARYGQLAVYEIDDRIRCVDVASASVVTSVGYRLKHRPAGDDVLARLTD